MNEKPTLVLNFGHLNFEIVSTVRCPPLGVPRTVEDLELSLPLHVVSREISDLHYDVYALSALRCTLYPMQWRRETSHERRETSDEL